VDVGWEQSDITPHGIWETEIERNNMESNVICRDNLHLLQRGLGHSLDLFYLHSGIVIVCPFSDVVLDHSSVWEEGKSRAKSKYRRKRRDKRNVSNIYKKN
jgi:hypothetical protein